MKTPKDIVLRRVLVGHRAAVNVVDFDDRYIVSASGDRTIKVRALCVNAYSEIITYTCSWGFMLIIICGGVAPVVAEEKWDVPAHGMH